MTTERSWWKLDLGDLDMDDLTDIDRYHIADQIREGYTSGEITRTEEDD